jgi:predicted DNA repair protein MutK
MATSLLVLLDDIATVLDDVAAMTKVAAVRTAGVLGDDLALNAEQVSGVRADRELPVVWAVFKGSARNKLILVPTALLLATIAPWMITPFLMLGGCYLCYEGFEKIASVFLHSEERLAEKNQVLTALHDPKVDLVTFEQEKIKGAIRTDFVLSAEIIVIALGTVQDAALITQLLTIITIAVLMTISVYGLVAGIVRLDDLGLHLIDSGEDSGSKKWMGEQILDFTPYLMRGLTIVGTAAMFLVGGGILAHGIPVIYELFELILHPISELASIGSVLTILASMLLNGLLGIIVGGSLVPVVSGVSWLVSVLRPSKKSEL